MSIQPRPLEETDPDIAEFFLKIVNKEVPFVVRDSEIIPLGPPVNRTPLVISDPKIGRNDPCTCGSGKKYKKCCSKN